jgi:hypothetical protein
MKLIQIFTIAACTTLFALMAAFVALPDNSGYFGLFLIGISPVVIFAFMMWSYFLEYLVNKYHVIDHILYYFILTGIMCYSIILFTIYGLNDGSTSDFRSFIDDAKDALSDIPVLSCVLLTTVLYSAIFNWLHAKRRTDAIR